MSEFLPMIKSKIDGVSIEINPNIMRAKRVSDGKNLGKIHKSSKGYYITLEGKRVYLSSKLENTLDSVL